MRVGCVYNEREVNPPVMKHSKEGMSMRKKRKDVMNEEWNHNTDVISEDHNVITETRRVGVILRNCTTQVWNPALPIGSMRLPNRCIHSSATHARLAKCRDSNGSLLKHLDAVLPGCIVWSTCVYDPRSIDHHNTVASMAQCMVGKDLPDPLDSSWLHVCTSVGRENTLHIRERVRLAWGELCVW